MMNAKHFLAKLLLAVSLAAASLHAAAAPIFTVRIDTATLGTGGAYLGLYFLGVGGAASSATVNGLAGALSGPASLSGNVSGGVPGPLRFGADGGGDVVQGVTLGGVFSFDVSFDPAGVDGATFGWALFDDTRYLGADGDLGNIFVSPDDAARQLRVMDASAISAVAVPEPATMSMLLLAAALMAYALRRPRQG